MAETHAALLTKEGRKVILHREVISSSRVEGISCAKSVLGKLTVSKKSGKAVVAKKCLVKKGAHKD